MHKTPLLKMSSFTTSHYIMLEQLLTRSSRYVVESIAGHKFKKDVRSHTNSCAASSPIPSHLSTSSTTTPHLDAHSIARTGHNPPPRQMGRLLPQRKHLGARREPRRQRKPRQILYRNRREARLRRRKNARPRRQPQTKVIPGRPRRNSPSIWREKQGGQQEDEGESAGDHEEVG